VGTDPSNHWCCRLEHSFYPLFLEHEMIYSIWTDNGEAVDFESTSQSLNEVLDEFCADAGYVDHADACQRMGWESSPFNIVEVPDDL
jgi:hypothetical protein